MIRLINKNGQLAVKYKDETWGYLNDVEFLTDELIPLQVSIKGKTKYFTAIHEPLDDEFHSDLKLYSDSCDVVDQVCSGVYVSSLIDRGFVVQIALKDELVRIK